MHYIFAFLLKYISERNIYEYIVEQLDLYLGRLMWLRLVWSYHLCVYSNQVRLLSYY